MRQKGIISSAFLLTLLIISSLVSCDDNTEDDMPHVDESSHPKEEYKNVFRSIPILFERLLFALHSKPEVLENDDVMAFNDVSKATVKEKRDIDNEHADKNDGFKTLKDTAKRYSNKEFNELDRYKSNAISKNVDPASKSTNKLKLNRYVDKASKSFISEMGHESGVKENNKRDILSQIMSFFGFDSKVDNEPEQEAADIYDNVEEDGADNKSDENNKDECTNDCEGIQFTIDEAEEKILMVENLLEDYHERNV